MRIFPAFGSILMYNVLYMTRVQLEQAELIIEAYKKHFDLEIAFLRVGVSDTDQEAILEDETFNQRILIIDSELHEEIITELKDIAMTSDNDGVRLTALRDLGKIFYAKRFKDTGPEGELRKIGYLFVAPEVEGD